MSRIILSNGTIIQVPLGVTAVIEEGSNPPAPLIQAKPGYESEIEDAFHLAKGEPTSHAGEAQTADPAAGGAPAALETNPGGVYPLSYPNGGQSMLPFHCTEAGLINFGPFVIPASGASPHAGRINVASPDDHGFAGILAISKVAGVVGGEPVVPNAWVNGKYPELLFVVGRDAGPGEGARLEVDTPYYVVLQVAVPDQARLYVAAPNRY